MKTKTSRIKVFLKLFFLFSLISLRHDSLLVLADCVLFAVVFFWLYVMFFRFLRSQNSLGFSQIFISFSLLNDRIRTHTDNHTACARIHRHSRAESDPLSLPGLSVRAASHVSEKDVASSRSLHDQRFKSAIDFALSQTSTMATGIDWETHLKWKTAKPRWRQHIDDFAFFCVCVFFLFMPELLEYRRDLSMSTLFTSQTLSEWASNVNTLRKLKFV